MTSFLLLWDGSDAGYDPAEYRRDQAATSRRGRTRGRWSFGRRVQGAAETGDRVFLLRQKTLRGIVASGRVYGKRGIYEARHWNAARGGTTKYIDVEWDAVVALDDRLPIEVLMREVPDFRWNFVRESGRELASPADAQVEALWARHLEGTYPVGAFATARAEAVSLDDAATPPGNTDAVALEALTTDTYDVVGSTTAQAVRKEAQLVERFRHVLEGRGHRVHRYRIPIREGRHLFTDVADLTENVLWEAKGVATREAVRTAIGQLMDYRRFVQPSPRLAVLLPERPESDLEQLLYSVGIELWYEDGGAFLRA